MELSILDILRAVYSFTQTKMGDAVGKSQTSISQLLRAGNYGALFEEHLQTLAQLFKTDLRTLRNVDLVQIVKNALADINRTFENGEGI